MVQTIITKGKAKIIGDGLRCAAPRAKDQSKVCNKLLAKKNSSSQIAGNFKCDKCKQFVEIEVILTK